MENLNDIFDFADAMLARGHYAEGLNADWCVMVWPFPWVVFDTIYLCDNEDDTFSLVYRDWRDDERDDQEKVFELLAFDTPQQALAWVDNPTLAPIDKQ